MYHKVWVYRTGEETLEVIFGDVEVGEQDQEQVNTTIHSSQQFSVCHMASFHLLTCVCEENS